MGEHHTEIHTGEGMLGPAAGRFLAVCVKLTLQDCTRAQLSHSTLPEASLLQMQHVARQLFLHAHAHTHKNTYEQTHTHMHTHTHTQTHMHTHTNTHTHTHKHTQTHTNTHTHLHKQIHTRTHTHTNARRLGVCAAICGLVPMCQGRTSSVPACT
jgi:carbohydrate-binding DOMON domain-containing protein